MHFACAFIELTRTHFSTIQNILPASSGWTLWGCSPTVGRAGRQPCTCSCLRQPFMMGRQLMWLKQTGRRTPGGEACKKKRKKRSWKNCALDRVQSTMAFVQFRVWDKVPLLLIIDRGKHMDNMSKFTISGGKYVEKKWGHNSLKDASIHIATRLKCFNDTLVSSSDGLFHCIILLMSKWRAAKLCFVVFKRRPLPFAISGRVTLHRSCAERLAGACCSAFRLPRAPNVGLVVLSR